MFNSRRAKNGRFQVGLPTNALLISESMSAFDYVAAMPLYVAPVTPWLSVAVFGSLAFYTDGKRWGVMVMLADRDS